MRGDFRPIELPVSGGRRSNIPPMSPEFPPADSPELMNVLVREGTNRKWPGTVPLALDDNGKPVPLPGPVRFLARFQLTSGYQFLIGSDGRDVWKFDSTNKEWDCLTPLYTTGDASFSGSEVTGTATLWTSDNCKPGMLIKRDAEGKWYEVESLDQEEQIITLTRSVDATGSGPYTLRQRLSAVGEHWVRGCVGLDEIILVNGVDYPLKWDGQEETFLLIETSEQPPYQESENPPRGRFVTSFHQKNLLVMAREFNHALRVYNSDAGDYTKWDPEQAGLQATYDFLTSGAPITGIDGTHEYLYVFRTDGIWRGFWEGTAVGISWARLPSPHGLVYPNSLVKLGGSSLMGTETPRTRWAYFGQGNIYACDGDEVVPIGDEVRDWVWSELDPTNPDLVVGTSVKEWNLALWSFPTSGSEITYNTGKAKFTQDSNVVEGCTVEGYEAEWAENNVRPGMEIKSSRFSPYYEIEAVDVPNQKLYLTSTFQDTSTPYDEETQGNWEPYTIRKTDVCTHTLAYDYKRHLWFPRDVGYSALGDFDLAPEDVIWDQLGGGPGEGEKTINEVNRIFDAMNTAPEPVTLCGDEHGGVHCLALAVNDHGDAIRANRMSPTIKPDPQGRAVEVGAVTLLTSADTGSTFTMSVYGSDDGRKMRALQSQSVKVNGGRAEGYFRCAAPYIAVEVSNDQAQEEFGLVGLTIWVKELGG